MTDKKEVKSVSNTNKQEVTHDFHEKVSGDCLFCELFQHTCMGSKVCPYELPSSER